MAKTRSSKVINGLEPRRIQCAFQLLFYDGFRYLDKCGEFLEKVTQSDSSWRPQNAKPASCELIHIGTGMNFVASTTSISSGLDRTGQPEALYETDVHSFASEINFLFETSRDLFNISQFRRLGYREIFVFGTETEEQAIEWLQALDVFKIADRIPAAFGANLSKSGCVVELETADRQIRINVSVAEINTKVDAGNRRISGNKMDYPIDSRTDIDKLAKKSLRVKQFPPAGVIVDFDTFVFDPKDFQAERFIDESSKLIFKGLYSLPQSKEK